MSTSIPNVTPATWPTVGTDFLAGTIRKDSPNDCKLALLGLPDDTGIKLNGGRPGAAQGPQAFREVLTRFGRPWDGVHNRALQVKIFDAGDIQPASGNDEAAMFETHSRIEKAVLEIHKLGLVPVCIGGGHDLTLPTVTALSKHLGAAVGGVNFDAHLDVRERVGSGMAYRKLILNKNLNPHHFVEAGLGRFTVSESDLDWITHQGAKLIFSDNLLDHVMPSHQLFKTAFPRSSPGFVSIDLDGIDSSQVPGVSAMNPLGLSVRHAATLAEAAGAEPAVRHFDIMELSPPHDSSGRSARVAALLFISFVAGFQGRSS